jgi:hypothetical protein
MLIFPQKSLPWAASYRQTTNSCQMLGSGDSKSVALPIILDFRETLLDVVCGDAKFFSPELKKLHQRLHSPLDAVLNSNATRQLRCTVQESNLQPSD